MEKTLEQELLILEKIAIEVRSRGGNMFFVGGYVRDAFTGKENKDIDVEVYALRPSVLKEVLSQFGTVDEVGASFGVYMIHGLSIDFSLPRREVQGKMIEEEREIILSKEAEPRTKAELERLYPDFKIVVDESQLFGHKDFMVVPDGFMSMQEASMRRDFTMNALMKHVITGKVYDFWNGQQDIENKIVRHINDKTFIEDPLRVLRACQFASRFDFEIHPDTINLCQSINLSTLAKERIYSEVEKALMKSERPSIAMEYWSLLGVTEKLFPELHALISCEQDPTHHAEGTVWNHTKLVIDVASEVKEKASNPTHFMFGSLCHDMGKAITTQIANGRITSHAHDVLGVKVAESFMNRMTTDKKLIESVKHLTKNHMRLLSLYPKGSDKAIRKLSLDTNIQDMRLFAEADYRGRGQVERDFTPISNWFEERIKEAGADKEIIPVVTGKDLIERGMKPGKDFGLILKQAMDYQLEGLEKESIIQKVLA
jgi:tRNA nucleotidyltransferase (CCA-adding enzyme)